MREMKDSGLEWIKKFPADWKVARLRDVIELLTDYTANGSFGDLAKNVQYLDYEDYARLIRLTDLRENLDNAGVYVSKYSYEYLAKSSLYGGEILVANVGAYAGLFCEMPSINMPATLGPNMFLIKTKPEMLQHYLYYLGKADFVWKQLVQKATSSAQPKLNKTDVKTTYIVVPPIQEQKQIADFLDAKCGEIDSLTADIQRQIDTLEQYKRSVITEAVTKGLNPDTEMKDSEIELLDKIPKDWSIKRVKYVSTSLSKGNGITKEDVKEDGDIQCVRYGEIYSKYENSFRTSVSSTNLENISSPKFISKGDILFAGTGELIEEIGKNIVYLGTAPCLAGGDIVIMRHSQNPVFLNYALNSDYSQVQKSKGKAKLKVVHISAFDIGNIRIALPPIHEQDAIAKFLDAKCAEINGITTEKKKQLEVLDEYKKSIIYEYVTGKKDVPADGE